MDELRSPEIDYEKYAAIFDTDWYFMQRPDVLKSGLDPIEHYIKHGVNENCDPHPLFDGSWYLEQNPDVAEAGLNPLTHYLTKGALCGCSPHPLFDSNWYLSCNSDVAAAGLNPLTHYLTYGALEGRDPHPLFDSNWYLGRNPDVAAAGLNPLVHYTTYGVLEERDPHPLFNSNWYRRSVLNSDADIKYLLHHFMLYSHLTKMDPNPLFSVRWYIESNADVDFSRINPLLHYLDAGWREGRDPHPLFVNKFYMDANKAVNFEEVNPLIHFLNTKIEEVADPNALFDCEWYLLKNQDVLSERLNPLVHYVHHGARQGRRPNRVFHGGWYKRHYLEAAASELEALAHYLRFGVQKNCKPNSNFDPSWYLSKYDDVGSSGMLPLQHFLKIGLFEGRDCIDPNFYYQKLVVQERVRFTLQMQDINRHIVTMLVRPVFLIFIDGEERTEAEETKISLRRQVYEQWKIISREDFFVISKEILTDRSNVFVWLCAGDRLHPYALYEYASAIKSHPNCDVFYADEDALDLVGQRIDPFYKPDWSPDYLESINYIGRAAAFRGRAATECLMNSAGHYDYVLRATEAVYWACHIPKILLHCLPRFVGVDAEIKSDCAALEQRLARTGRHGNFAPIFPNERCYRAVADTTDQPRISIIIPTAGRTVEVGSKSIDLILNCVELIHSRSSYKNFEIAIVHNGDLSKQQIDYLSIHANCLVCYEEPVFNVSKKLNLGVSHAKGEYLILLNDDIEPLSSDWMERMLFQLQKPHVGVVGAKLVYVDYKPQHVGVVTNSGNPDHVRRFVSGEERGYYYSSCSTKNFSAVTGACMMSSKESYLAVGGYTDELAVSYNDVDYCFKLRNLGLSVVFEPSVQLIHFESKSRVASLDPAEHAFFHNRWAHILERDPYYNEDFLTVKPSTFRVKTNNTLDFEGV